MAFTITAPGPAILVNTPVGVVEDARPSIAPVGGGGWVATWEVDGIIRLRVYGDDSFQLDNAVFKKLGKGSPTKPVKLLSDAFHKGKVAADREDRILYNKGTGALYYDADGSGAAKAIKFAQLKKGLALTNADFFVI